MKYTYWKGRHVIPDLVPSGTGDLLHAAVRAWDHQSGSGVPGTMTIAGMQLRDHRTVQAYEDHYEGRTGERLPCPACGQRWSAPSPVDRSRELVHVQHCDYMNWLREDDVETPF